MGSIAARVCNVLHGVESGDEVLKSALAFSRVERARAVEVVLGEELFDTPPEVTAPLQKLCSSVYARERENGYSELRRGSVALLRMSY